MEYYPDNTASSMQTYQDFQDNAASSNRNGQEARSSASIPGRDDDRKLFIGGLSRHTTDKELTEHFGKFGDIESITVKVDPYTGQSRGFAFIVFTNASTIDKLLTAGDHFINKRRVDPKRVSKKTQQGKIFVGGLSQDISEIDIRNYFSQYGTVVEVQCPFDRIKNQRKGFCFVTFDAKEVVFELLKQPKQFISGKEVDVKKVKVNPDNIMQGVGRGGGVGVGRGGGWPTANPSYAPYGGGFSGAYGGGGFNAYDFSAPIEEFDGTVPSQGAFIPAGGKHRGGRPTSFIRHLHY